MDGCQVSKNDGLPCGRPGHLVRMACVHEHMADGWICDEHDAQLGGGWLCIPCQEADGHECPLVMVLLADDAQRLVTR